MVAYLVRRYLPIVLLAPPAVFTILVYAPGGVREQVETLNRAVITKLGLPLGHRYEDDTSRRLVWIFHLNKPYPQNYTTWLLDPDDTLTMNNRDELVSKGIDIEFLGIRIKGSGALTGDLGFSTEVALAVPVMDVYGAGAGELWAFMLLALATGVLIILVSKVRRHAEAILTLPSRSYMLTERYLHPIGSHNLGYGHPRPAAKAASYE